MSLLLTAALAQEHDHAPLAAGLASPCVEAEVPIINISALVQGRWDARAVASALVDAARNGSAGFFTITGHGLGHSLSDMQRVADDFFSLPLDEKMRLAPKQFNAYNSHRFRGYAPATVNGKEILDWSNPAFSQPSYMQTHHSRHNASDERDAATRAFLHEPMPCLAHRPELCVALAAHWQRMQAIGEVLLKGLAIGLGDLAGRGDADADFFGRVMRVGEPLSCLRFNYYPLVSASGDPVRGSKIEHQKTGLACEEHRDMTLITLLDQGRQRSAPLLFSRLPCTTATLLPVFLPPCLSFSASASRQLTFFGSSPYCRSTPQATSEGCRSSKAAAGATCPLRLARSSSTSVAVCSDGQTTRSSPRPTACGWWTPSASPSPSSSRLPTTARWIACLRPSARARRADMSPPSTDLTFTRPSRCSKSMQTEESEGLALSE